MDTAWVAMTADEKQEVQFQKLLAPKGPGGDDLKFQKPEAAARYKASVTRLKDAIQMKKRPDRIPLALLPGFWPYYRAGITIGTAMNDYDQCTAAFRQFVLDYQPDMNIGPETPGPAKFYEILDYKLYSWPGHGVAPENPYQCNEDEYMKPEEYDLFLSDPSYYFSNFYLPRVFGALSGFRMLPNLTGILEMYGLAYSFIPFGLPPVQETYRALFEAGAEALKWATAMGTVKGELTASGYPNILGGYTKAPFDTMGDTLRGTRPIMMDMFRRPEKLLAAMDALVPIMINMGVGSMQATGNPLIFIPLHKAADGFLSDAQFRKFYWPTFRKVLMGLIDAGCIPFPALEGGWGSRMEVIQDLPKGKSIWMVDQTDIHLAKKTLGQVACLCGNVSSAMLKLSTPAEVKDYCRKLIDTVGRDGGFVLSNGAFFDEANPDNVMAMVGAARG